MTQPLKIYNGKLITPNGLIPGGTIIVDGDRIVSVAEGDDEIADAIEIDATHGRCERRFLHHFKSFCSYAQGIAYALK